jgi:hypothetical protein
MWQGDGKSLDIVNDSKNNNQPILAPKGNYSGQYWKLTKTKEKSIEYNNTRYRNVYIFAIFNSH